MIALVASQALPRSTARALCFAAATLAMAPAALHAQDCTPVGGAITAALLGGEPTTALGTVTGGLSGATRAVVTRQTPQEDGSVELALRHDFVTAEGAVLETEDAATWLPFPSREGVFLMTTDYTITGGTGRWKGATGTLANEGIADTGSGVLTLRYTGEVCTGAPAR